VVWIAVRHSNAACKTRLRALAPIPAPRRGAYYVALAFGGFVGSLVIGCLLPYYLEHRFAARGDTGGGTGASARSGDRIRSRN
jgi:hypothetical protein